MVIPDAQAGDIKVVVAGPKGAGKTTAIRCISDDGTVSTEVPMSGGPVGEKSSTTVGLDYGTVAMEGGRNLRLIGTPGQERFEFMWDILAKGAFGLIVLADNRRADPVADVQRYLKAFSTHIGLRRTVVGVGRLDTHPSPAIDDYVDRLGTAGYQLPVIDVDVRRPADVRLMLSILLSMAETDSSLPRGGSL